MGTTHARTHRTRMVGRVKGGGGGGSGRARGVARAPTRCGAAGIRVWCKGYTFGVRGRKDAHRWRARTTTTPRSKPKSIPAAAVAALVAVVCVFSATNYLAATAETNDDANSRPPLIPLNLPSHTHIPQLISPYACVCM